MGVVLDGRTVKDIGMILTIKVKLYRLKYGTMEVGFGGEMIKNIEMILTTTVKRYRLLYIVMEVSIVT